MTPDDLTLDLAAIDRQCMAKAEKRSRNMRYPFTHQIRDEDGRVLIPDVEVEVEVEVESSPADFIVEVVGVWIDADDKSQVDMIRSKSPTIKAIGCTIAEEAERNEEIVRQAMEHEGVVYRGMGGNDPDGRFLKVTV